MRQQSEITQDSEEAEDLRASGLARLLGGSTAPTVAYGKLAGYVNPSNWKHRFVQVEVSGLSDSCTGVELDVAKLGMKYLVHLAPTPVGWHGSVVWDGDTRRPRILFDGWPSDGKVRVQLDVVGR